MRKSFLSALCFLLISISHAQTNKFPGQGNVGIGTINPLSGLQIGELGPNIESKQIVIPGVYNFEKLKLGHLENGAMALEMVNHSGPISSYGMRMMTHLDQGGPGLQFQFASSKTSYEELQYETAMFISSIGQIGIGTVTPREKLSVNGKIRAHEIKVETAYWPDYVFAKDYPLPSLAETEKHIIEKGHLQGIPSAEEVKSDGIDLGDMNAKLLQKIEELTLLLIEEHKTLKEQVQKLEVQGKKIEQQQTEINQLKRNR
jgi:hypothetical protein